MRIKHMLIGLGFFPCVVIGLMIPCIVNAQPAQLSDTKTRNMDTIKISGRPELLTSGFLDVMNSGQVNASARFIRVYIGEPGKFAIPLSVYSGVSSNNFQQSITSSRSNEQLVNNLINPLSGLTNVSIDGVIFLNARQKQVSKVGVLYQIGEKILTGDRKGINNSFHPLNFLNSYGVAGLYFQTGAWERNDTRNLGIFWVTLRYIASYSVPSQLRQLLTGITHGWFHGFSIGWGMEISQLVNIKILFYQYSKAPEPAFGLPIYQCSFHYSLK